MIGGRTIVIKGDISGSEELVIAGRVEGSITLEGQTLTLAPDSHVTGKVDRGVGRRGRLAGRPRRSRRPRREFATPPSCTARFRPPDWRVVDGATLDCKVEMPAGTRRTRAA